MMRVMTDVEAGKYSEFDICDGGEDGGCDQGSVPIGIERRYWLAGQLSTIRYGH